MNKFEGLKTIGMITVFAVTASFPATVFAEGSTKGIQKISAVTVQENLSKDDARKIVSDYLKSKKKRDLRVGKIKKKKDYWVVQIITREDFPIKTAMVNENTGKLSFKKKKRN